MGGGNQNKVRISVTRPVNVVCSRCVENAVHAECALPRGHHQLPAGGAGREIFPAGQVAVHGPGRGAGPEEQHQVKQPSNNNNNKKKNI